MPRETRECPLFTMANIMSSKNEKAYCKRLACEWWRGNQENGCCAVWDIAGYLDSFYKMAGKDKANQEPELDPDDLDAEDNPEIPND